MAMHSLPNVNIYSHSVGQGSGVTITPQAHIKEKMINFKDLFEKDQK